ncbi:MAG: uroporphyrinogen decarboxylase family protein [Phycisphaerae bacterium]|jgi:uroporphyrinogen-III decarboxylase
MKFTRNQYLDLMFGRDTSRQMFVELFGPLIGLEEEWIAQGATPEELAMTAFDWDYVPFTDCGANAFFHGQLATPEIIQETDEYILGRDLLGRTTKLCKGSSTISMPQDYPVRDMNDWKKIKHLFEYNEKRVNLEKINEAKELRQEGYVIVANIFGSFDTIRMLMGEENCCISYYSQPELIHDIIDTITSMTTSVFERVLEMIPIDQLQVHEDMAGKAGPMVGHKQIVEFFKPYYGKIWDMFSSYGTRIFQMDSDGNVNPIIDVLLDCGINSIYPMEPAAGMDIVAVRKKYGQKLYMVGGIDKHILRMTKTDIRKELEYKMQPLMKQGGMIFGLDHRIPNGTPLENYRYYVDIGREILGLPPRNAESKGWQRMAFCGASIL